MGAADERRPLLADKAGPNGFGTADSTAITFTSSESGSSSGAVTPSSLEAVGAGKDAPAITSLGTEAWLLWRNSRPLIITFLLQQSLIVTSTVTVGALGKTELAAATLGVLTANITAYCPYQGFNAGLDTLCSQAFGAGKKHLVGLYLQRMVLLLLVLTIPIATLWWHSASILGAFIDDEDVVRLAAQYLRIAIIGMPAYATFDAIKRYCQAQALYSVTRNVLLLCCPLNAFLHWLFVWHLGFGFVGAPAALVTTEFAMLTSIWAYIHLIDGSQCWGGFDRRAFHHWWPMIKLSLPAMLMLFSEWFAFEVLTISAGRIGSTALAAQSVLVSVGATAYMFPLPVSIALANRIGYFVGAADIKSARVVAKLGFLAGLVVVTHNVIVLSLLRPYIPGWITTDPDVIALATAALPALILLQIPDGLNCLVCAVVRGVGRQDFGGSLNLAMHYLIGLPLSMYFCFWCGYGIGGLWLGLVVSVGFTAAVCFIFIARLDWRRCVLAAADRNALG